MKTIAMAGVLALMTVSNADAALLTYNVSGVFEDNTTMNGSLRLNDEATDFYDQFSNISITLSAPAGFVATEHRGGSYYSLGGSNVGFMAYMQDANSSSSVTLGLLANYLEGGLVRKITSDKLQTTRLSFGTFYTKENGTNVFLSSGAITLGQAVPEPTTWAMFIGGFGLVGYALRRRHRVKISAF